MEQPVCITYREKTYTVEPHLTILEALEKLGIIPETVLAICGGRMIGGETELKAGDEVRLVSVISGG
jgi:sulfur carrier protein ThiS